MHMSTLSSALGVMSAVKRRRPLYELILVIGARSSVSPRCAAPRPAGPIPVVEEEIENEVQSLVQHHSSLERQSGRDAFKFNCLLFRRSSFLSFFTYLIHGQ
jgi:hypothetical protein